MDIAARFSDETGHVVSATVDGVEWFGVDLTVDGEIANRVKAWIAEGGTPQPYLPPA